MIAKILFLISIMLALQVSTRKTYKVKEKIVRECYYQYYDYYDDVFQGIPTTNPYRPVPVMETFNNTWCHNEAVDGIDKFCIDNNVLWRTGNKMEYTSPRDFFTDIGKPDVVANYHFRMKFYSEQWIEWRTEWNMQRLQN
jgi:hypothetical protein